MKRKRLSSTPVRASISIRLLLCGIACAAMLLSASSSLAGVPRPGRVGGARIADVENVKLKLSLEITSIKGNIIFAQGRVSGPKFSGSAYLHLNLINASRAQATFSAYNSHGSLNGSGSAPYRVSGAVSYFTGGSPSIHGTGKYAKTKSLGMKMSGSMNRRTLQIAIDIQGRMSD